MAQVAIILLACGPYAVIVNCWDRFCTLGRAPCTKETLPDFREWCWVTRHPQVFRGLTGCQRSPRERGVTERHDLSEVPFGPSVIVRLFHRKFFHGPTVVNDRRVPLDMTD